MKKTVLFLIFALTTPFVFSQSDVNYDESKVPHFIVPNPLETFNGKKLEM